MMTILAYYNVDEPQSAFAFVDWMVIVGYGLVLLVSGVLINRKQQESTADYFLAARSMPAWAVAVSIMATTLSAATFVGVPDISFKGDWTYLQFQIGMVVAIVIVAMCFIPVFYRENVGTVYELLGMRYGQVAHQSASVMFMVGRLLASGSRIFMAALPLAYILFGDFSVGNVSVAIGLLVLVGVGYTLVGGIASVIWADVLQAGVFMLAAVIAVYFLLDALPETVGVAETLTKAMTDHGTHKLQVFDVGLDESDGQLMGIDWTSTFSLLSTMTGFLLFNIAAFGTDHDMVQRMLTCKNALSGSKSTLLGVGLTLPAIAMFLLIGSLLYLFYQQPEMAGGLSNMKGQKIFPVFIATQMSDGLRGLLLAGVFAAGLSSLNSALNAMSATFVTDVYRKMIKGRAEHHYVVVGRVAIIGWGIVLGLFAVMCAYWQKSNNEGLISFALGVMGFAYSGLLAVFITAIFTKRGSTLSVISALVVGFLVTLLLQPFVWDNWVPEGWGVMKLAFTWKMLIATLCAFMVCMCGNKNLTKDIACKVSAETGK